MKKINLKIKDAITMDDKVNAINAIVDSCFEDGEYTPYNLNHSLINYIVIFCIEGYELEAYDSIYDIAINDPELRELVMKFFRNEDESKEYPEYIEIQEFIMRNVTDIVSYKRERLIHCADLKEDLYSSLASVFDSIVDISKNISAAAKPVLENPESAKHMLSVLRKLDSNDVISKDTITEIVMDIVKKMKK